MPRKILQLPACPPRTELLEKIFINLPGATDVPTTTIIQEIDSELGF